ncbi:[protein-PII] uridylyltransferase [Shewanella intestini]|uniref:Bifunctional uridylyltransferase/uridylyl-removing enzyme n=1 Tax=Shewanella intestini TaxID=2017544 RepID=A0ABS5I3I4_9GAMM|nr:MULTISPECIES: [protein-PII] uridylyltransferase [Shewanella]MBR9728466.1 [protein-PII] uridylyltransferase [Shewanella intestini]MRG36285.1 [protein-PII] uridylyltransferase [Shewanella sp. XMDDZSB0408]
MFSLPEEAQLRPHMSIVELKAAIQAVDAFLQVHILDYSINETLSKRAIFFDQLLTQLWQEQQLAPETISLNAVGGYGRQALHPFSDIDICIIHSQPLNKVDGDKVSAFLTQLWDLNLDLGHGVRTLDDTLDACKDDVTIATSLLEIRHLVGNEQHQQQVLDALYGNALWTSQRFFSAKKDEQQQRHLKAGGTAYSIEPNLKNSPGGIRDIQTLAWVSRKHFNAQDMHAVRSQGFFSHDEYAELIECQNVLFRVRFALHQVASRPENRLLLQYQADVAKIMGFGEDSQLEESGNIAIEKMMRQLFRAMKRIRELNQLLMAYFERAILPKKRLTPTPLNEQFEIIDNHIHVRHEDVFIDRTQIMALFELIAIHHDEIVGITPETLRLLRQVRRRLMGDLQDFHACRQQFLSLFQHHQGMGLAITLMHQYGILSAYLPQWREIVGQMQFDLFHAYTVDEHTHKVLKNIARYANSQGNDVATKLASEIYQKMTNKSSLLLGALFHDLAKGRGGDHSELGAVDVLHFAKFHGIKQSQQQLIAWLVKQHLLMSITSQRMDIYDPDVVWRFAKTVGTQARLDALYCLTIADIQATNDDLWNDWKASLIRDLYFATRKALRNGGENVLQLRTVVREHKQEALTLMALDDTGEQHIKALWQKLPISFFSHAEADDIARYSQALIAHKATLPDSKNPFDTLISIDDAVVKGCSDVFVYTKDRAGLFVKLFNTLSALQISVKQAQISRTKDGYVVESFKILDFDEKPIGTQQRRQHIINKLKSVLDNNAKPPKMRLSRQHQSFDNQPNVEFLYSRHSTRSLLSVSALDTHEFMEQIASAFRALELNIHSATISSVGERADNVFLVSNSEGQQLTEAEQQQLSRLLITTINDTDTACSA